MKLLIGLAFIMLMAQARAQDTLILQPGPEGIDADINSIDNDINNGDSFKFKSMAWTHHGVPGNHRGLIQFNLSSLPPNTIIHEAKLDLFFGSFEVQYLPHTGINASYLLKIIDPWSEYDVTWDNQPETTPEDAVLLPESNDPEQDYTGIDITEMIRKMVTEPENNFGMMLQLADETYYRCLLFCSGDCLDTTKRPRLTIIYDLCPETEVNFDFTAQELMVNFMGISPSASSWLWNFGDGYLAEIQNPQHQFSTPGVYEVCLTVTDTCSSVTKCKEIQVIQSFVDDKPDSAINFFPNPALDYIAVTPPDPGEFNVQIVDVKGKLWIDQEFTGLGRYPVKIDIRRIPGGFYLLVVNQDRNTRREKLMIMD